MPHNRRGVRTEINPARHESQCSICTHLQRQEIDEEFVNWTSPTRIATAYRLSRDAIYRHARATGLLPKRQRNVRAALEKIIERSGEVKVVNAAAIVAAVGAYARINTAGQWIQRSEMIDVNQLFERMTLPELDAYARDGTLPSWFSAKPQHEVEQDLM